MNINCGALIGLDSYTELRVFLSWNWFLVLILLLVVIVSGLLLLKCKNNGPETNFTHFCIAIMFMINDQLYLLNTVGHLYTGPLTFYEDFRKLGPSVSNLTITNLHTLYILI